MPQIRMRQCTRHRHTKKHRQNLQTHAPYPMHACNSCSRGAVLAALHHCSRATRSRATPDSQKTNNSSDNTICMVSALNEPQPASQAPSWRIQAAPSSASSTPHSRFCCKSANATTLKSYQLCRCSRRQAPTSSGQQQDKHMCMRTSSVCFATGHLSCHKLVLNAASQPQPHQRLHIPPSVSTLTRTAQENSVCFHTPAKKKPYTTISGTPRAGG